MSSSKFFVVLGHVLVLLVIFIMKPVESSSGSFRYWGIPLSPSSIDSVHQSSSPTSKYVDPEIKRRIDRALATIERSPRAGDLQMIDNDDSDDNDVEINGGFVRFVGTVTQALISCGRAVLPPTVAVVRSVVNFYRALPTDAVVAQIGLVYCFAGGYYPTLFSSLQAAQQCGWKVMVAAIQDLTDEAIKVIDATAAMRWDDLDGKELFLQQTNIVLKTVDPMKINQAAGALYTTWLGVSAVLEKEYARVISLSLTLAGYLEGVAHWILEPPVKLFLSEDYHNWVPVIIGWGCKAMAMNVAWRIQRVLTASTSAVAGGIMFARALIRMMHRRGIRFFGWIEETGEETPLDEIIGFPIAALGFWTQIETQFKNNFSFEVPFPFSLISWPLDLLEKWIQWQITK